jgi:hypothetical protein
MALRREAYVLMGMVPHTMKRWGTSRSANSKRAIAYGEAISSNAEYSPFRRLGRIVRYTPRRKNAAPGAPRMVQSARLVFCSKLTVPA